MAKITFILGLSGSGKTELIKNMKAKDANLYSIDEGFNPCSDPDFVDKYLKVKNNISQNHDCAIVEIEMCREPFRSNIAGLFREIPNIKIEWMCFENDLRKANRNLGNANRKKGNIRGHEDINSRVSPDYTFPEGAIMMAIYSKDN